MCIKGILKKYIYSWILQEIRPGMTPVKKKNIFNFFFRKFSKHLYISMRIPLLPWVTPLHLSNILSENISQIPSEVSPAENYNAFSNYSNIAFRNYYEVVFRRSISASLTISSRDSLGNCSKVYFRTSTWDVRRKFTMDSLENSSLSMTNVLRDFLRKTFGNSLSYFARSFKEIPPEILSDNLHRILLE